MSLKNTTSEEDQINYIKTQIERNLCLPYNSSVFANMKFWAEKLSGDLRKHYISKIMRWFYDNRDIDKKGIREFDSNGNG